MKILFFGDVYAKPGRESVKKAILELQKELNPDFVGVNAENAAHGKGLTPEMAEEFFAAGVDFITLGNHTWQQKSIIPFLNTCTRIVRPANYPDHPLYKAPGRGQIVVSSQNNPQLRLGVLQVMGRVYMDAIDCPFRAATQAVERFEELDISCILVDMHAEATSEKQALSHYLDGKVGAVLGTHSHVATADERILPYGTAAITDVGMCGVLDSVIGMKKEIAIQKFLTRRPLMHEPAIGAASYHAVYLELENHSGKALSIQRLQKMNIPA